MKSDTTILHVGLDVHQESIAVAIASGEGSVRHYGDIPGQLRWYQQNDRVVIVITQ